jgi:hypothetical protein
MVALSKEVNPDGTLQSEEVTRLALCSLKEGLKAAQNPPYSAHVFYQR